MISMIWIDKPRGMLLVVLGIPHLGGGVCWIPLRTWPQTKLRTKKSWWKIHEVKSTVDTRAFGEAKSGGHCFNVQRDVEQEKEGKC